MTKTHPCNIHYRKIEEIFPTPKGFLALHSQSIPKPNSSPGDHWSVSYHHGFDLSFLGVQWNEIPWYLLFCGRLLSLLLFLRFIPADVCINGLFLFIAEWYLLYGHTTKSIPSPLDGQLIFVYWPCIPRPRWTWTLVVVGFLQIPENVLHVLSCHLHIQTVFFYFVLSIRSAFFPLLFMVLGQTSRTVSNGNSESQYCLVPDLKRKAFSVSPFSLMLAIGFS